MFFHARSCRQQPVTAYPTFLFKNWGSCFISFSGAAVDCVPPLALWPAHIASLLADCAFILMLFQISPHSLIASPFLISAALFTNTAQNTIPQKNVPYIEIRTY